MRVGATVGARVGASLRPRLHAIVEEYRGGLWLGVEAADDLLVRVRVRVRLGPGLGLGLGLGLESGLRLGLGLGLAP